MDEASVIQELNEEMSRLENQNRTEANPRRCQTKKRSRKKTEPHRTRAKPNSDYLELEKELDELESQTRSVRSSKRVREYSAVERERDLDLLNAELDELGAPNVASCTTEVCDADVGLWHCRVDEDIDDFDQAFSDLNEECQNLEQLIPSATRRRLTFIESSIIEWAEYSERLYKLYERGLKVASSTSDIAVRCKAKIYEEDCRRCDSECFHSTKQITIIGLNVQTHTVESCARCPVDFVEYGLWPISTKSHTFMTFETIQLLSTLTNFSPTTSVTSIVNTLNFNTQWNSKGSHMVRSESLSASMREWRKLEHERYGLFTHQLTFKCPACGDNPHTVHLDGNCKLYRYSAAGNVSSTTVPCESTGLFLDSEAVKDSVAHLRQNKVKVDSQCGESTWKAANVGGRKFAKKDETGVMLATCRHTLILKALDMYRGEIYEYPYLLQLEFPDAKFMALDTVCQYWPWLSRVDADLHSKHKPLLSVMHAKAHNWNCQIKWSGKNQEGAGESTGETTEQANSFLSRFGLVTRHMHSSARRERLTQVSAFWNLRMIADLPVTLTKKMMATAKKVEHLTEQVEIAATYLHMTEEQLYKAANDLQHFFPENATMKERKVEQLAAKYHRLTFAIQTQTDSSKDRDKKRTQLSKTKNDLEVAVGNVIDKGEYTKEAVKMGCSTMKFPWSMKGADMSLLQPDMLYAIELANSLVRAKEEVLILAEERMKLLKYIVDGCVEERVSPLMNMLAESVSEWKVILYEEENLSSGSESEEDSDND